MPTIFSSVTNEFRAEQEQSELFPSAARKNEV